ncbi:MAG TPA: hypothetical protein VGC89_03520 [Pyrinomonadaceae bacterium]
MTSKKRKYGNLSERPLPTEDESLVDDVFAAFTRRPASIPPAHHAPPARYAPDAQHASGAQKAPDPLHDAPDAQHAPPAPHAPVVGFTRVPNDMLDRILPTLDIYGQSLLLRLYRLSRGFNCDTCNVSVAKLATACNFSARKVQMGLATLEMRGLIHRLTVDHKNRDFNLRGITFRILISDPSPARRAPPAQSAPDAPPAPGAPDAPNKVNTQKENTQTQEGVRAGSKFTIEECRRYAEHLRSTGQGINNPGGYATTIHRTGEADLLIENFLHPATSTQMDTSQCPDCQGSGFYYPNGPTSGVAKCKHEKLQTES